MRHDYDADPVYEWNRVGTLEQTGVAKHLDVMAFRACDRLTGRFNSVDPLSSAMSGWSGYSMNFGSPLSYVDPLGLAPQATAEQLETFNRAKAAAGDPVYSDSGGDPINPLQLFNEVMDSAFGAITDFINSFGETTTNREVMNVAGKSIEKTAEAYDNTYGMVLPYYSSMVNAGGGNHSEAGIFLLLDLFTGGKGSKTSKILLWGSNSKGHLIKHADALGFGDFSPQQLQKMLSQLRGSANQLLNSANPAFTRIGSWNEIDNAIFYISNGKMLVTKSNGEFLTVINKTPNKWYNTAKSIGK